MSNPCPSFLSWMPGILLVGFGLSVAIFRPAPVPPELIRRRSVEGCMLVAEQSGGDVDSCLTNQDVRRFFR